MSPLGLSRSGESPRIFAATALVVVLATAALSLVWIARLRPASRASPPTAGRRML